MEKVIYKVNEGDDQKRLDLFVLEKLPVKVSRNMIQELIKSGAVTVNGGIKKSHYLVKKGDEIVICLDNLEISDDMNEEDSISPENIPLDILYEDEDIIVINKPAGLLVHPTNKIRSGTLVNALMYHIKDFDKIGDDPNRLGIVHRLDKDTSGVLVVGKNSYSKSFLSDQFKERKTKKIYLTIVRGLLKEKEGEITLPLGRHPTSRQKRAVVFNGREAVTFYKVLKEFNSLASLVWVQIETGRTHQIRVHFKYIGNPVVGDTLYGKNKFEKSVKIPIERQMLHALKLGIYHPRNGKWMEFLAPLPEDFKKVLMNFSNDLGDSN